MAFVGLTFFILVYCARPNDWIPGFMFFPFAKIAGVLALAGFLAGIATNLTAVRHLPREMIYLILLLLHLCVSIPFSIWPGGSFEIVMTEYWKVVLIAVITAMSVTTFFRLKAILLLHVGSVSLMAVLVMFGMGGTLTSPAGMQRQTGVVGGVFGNPNDFAFSIAQVFPIAFAFLLATRNIFAKLLWIAVMAAMAQSVVASYSRGALIAFLFAVAILVWEFGVKGRRHQVLLIVGLGVLALLIVGGPKQYGERLMSIFDPELDESGSSTAREVLLRRSIDATIRNPVFGVGPGNFQVLSGFWHTTHNTFTQLSSEAGIPALILFLLIFRQAFFNLRPSRDLSESEAELKLLAEGLRASLVCFLVGGMFFGTAYHFFPYLLVGYTSAAHQVIGTALKSPEARDRPATKRIFPRSIHDRTTQSTRA